MIKDYLLFSLDLDSPGSKDLMVGDEAVVETRKARKEEDGVADVDKILDFTEDNTKIQNSNPVVRRRDRPEWNADEESDYWAHMVS